MAFLLAMAAAAAVSTAEGPHWLAKPTPEDIAQAYPPRARKRGMAGRVILECKVAKDGSLEACLAEERPAGSGFAAAALSLTSRFRMSDMGDGTSGAGGTIRIPINFLPSDAKP